MSKASKFQDLEAEEVDEEGNVVMDDGEQLDADDEEARAIEELGLIDDAPLEDDEVDVYNMGNNDPLLLPGSAGPHDDDGRWYAVQRGQGSRESAKEPAIVDECAEGGVDSAMPTGWSKALGVEANNVPVAVE